MVINMSRKIDLSNTENQYFKIFSPAPNKGKRTYWNCLCKRCGKECVIPTDSLQNKKNPTKSCGCLKKDMLSIRNKSNYKNLVNQKFGLLTCIKYIGSLRGHAAWLCKCDCGNTIITDSGSLMAGYRVSCGCLRQSIGEKNIETILKLNNISYQKEYSFSDLLSENNVPLRFDFAIFNEENQLIRLIEYDGEQHFQKKADLIFSDNLQKRKERDKLKNKYCLTHNIPLVRISYNYKNKITLNMILNDESFLVKEG